MAAASAILSGAFRISNVNVVFNRAFSGIVTVSTWLTQEILLANGVSDTVFSRRLRPWSPLATRAARLREWS